MVAQSDPSMYVLVGVASFTTKTTNTYHQYRCHVPLKDDGVVGLVELLLLLHVQRRGGEATAFLVGRTMHHQPLQERPRVGAGVRNQ